VNNRLERLRARFAASEIDAMLVSSAENRRYLSGFHGTAGYLLITADKAVLATDFRYTEQALAQAPDFEILRIANNLADWFPGLVSDMGIGRLGFEGCDITYQVYHQLTEALKKGKSAASLVPLDGLVEQLRVVKEPGEIELIRRSAAITDKAFEAVADEIRPGITELELAWELEKALRENGSQTPAFEIIVASGPNAALPHAKPSHRTIGEGETVIIDMGARCEGYAADLSRTVCAGPPDATFKKVYQTVLDAQAAAVAIIAEGTTGHQADNAARSVITKAGYGEAFGHSLGHGVGLAAHELPRLSPGAAEPLRDGMVFTVEPGIYISGWGGVRIEDLVMMENGRVVPLSGARKASYD
jgi:Xaa-Pro aminopeptidase